MKLSSLLILICSCLVLHCTSGEFISNKCRRGLDIVFLLDMSGSIGSRHFRTMLEATIGISNSLTIGPFATQVGVDVFSTGVTTEIRLKDHNNINTLRSAIRRIRYLSGMTNTFLGLDNLRLRSFTPRNGDRRGYPNVAIVMTDGNSQNKKKTLNAAKLARLYGIKIIAIGIGNNIDWDEIDGIDGDAFSSQASKKAMRAKTFSTLLSKSFQQDLTRRICVA